MIKRINKSPIVGHYVRLITTSSDIKSSYRLLYNQCSSRSKLVIASKLMQLNYELYLDICK